MQGGRTDARCPGLPRLVESVNENRMTDTSTLTHNPLLTREFPIPFSAVRAEEIEPAVGQLLQQVQQKVDAIAAPDTPRTYRDILGALDTVTEPLDFAVSLVRHLESVATTAELRAANNAIQGPVSMFYTSIPLNAQLWSAVRAVAENPEEVAALTPVEKRYLEKSVRGFRRAGADLSDENKRKLEQLDVELTKVTTRFAENVLDATNAYEKIITDQSALAGLPESALAAARESAKTKGREGWRFTLQAPSYVPVLTYLDDRALRQEFWEASNRRATAGEFDNRDLILNILQLRQAKAELLGYRDFADLVLEERMAQSGETAQTFIEDLRVKTVPFFTKENETLAQLGRTLGYNTMEPWDVSYLAEKQRQALYDFDEEELRPYFQLERVAAGMYDIFSNVLGIRVIEEPNVPGWDPAVRYYRVQDGVSGELLGGFYADWYPRENKRGGAWMDALITGDPAVGLPHLGLICGNLTPPVEDRPSLLTLREVETIFHEFGHLLHHVLSRVPVRSLAGTSVPWDFVELPSQIMENWCMEREALNTFARHYQTGEAIPEELFQKMVRAKTFRSANAQMRQLGFSMMDLRLHREFNRQVQEGATGAEALAFARDVLSQYTAAPLPDDYGMVASFTHLFASPVAYGAGYYSYKWAEVLDADAFTRFKQEGIFSTTVGHAYRHTILERGDSDDPKALYRDFMGREPNAEALLERLGLVNA